MKKSDKQILDMLEKEINKSAQNAEIPLKLQRESIVNMLEREQNKADFSQETGNSRGKNSNIIVLRKLTAIAAMLAIVVSGVLVMRSVNGVKVVKTDSFYEGYKGNPPVKNAQSYEDVEIAVREILSEKSENTAKATEPKVGKHSQTEATLTKKDIKSFFEGYGGFIAAVNSGKENESDSIKTVDSNEPDGVSSYGDFKADILKNDGEFLYIASTGVDEKTGEAVEQIKVVKAQTDGTMNEVSSIVLSGVASKENFDECVEIYLKSNKLIAILNRHSYTFSNTAVNDSISTVAVYYDISNPYAPKKIREHIQDGKYISSNLYKARLCLVTAKTIPSDSETIPSYSINGKTVKPKAENIFIAVNDPEASYLFVTVTNVADFRKGVGCLAVLGCGDEVYCSSSALAVSRNFVSVEADKKGEHKKLTEVYRFSVSDYSIDFSGSYIVEGELVGGVSVDEKDGSMKVVTSTNKANNIYVLNSEMEFVSGLQDVFAGERVTSVKYIGSNCYVSVDGEEEKTMIIDFSDPSQPVVAGTIPEKVFTDDLYAVSDGILLGIKESESGEVALTLFDVSNPNEPKASASYTLDKSCYSLFAGDSRSVMLDSDKKIFGIPIVKKNAEDGTEISAYALFDASDGTIASLGTYNHDISYIGDAAVRGTCIEDILYTVSGGKIVAFPISEDKTSEIINNLKEFPLY